MSDTWSRPLAASLPTRRGLLSAVEYPENVEVGQGHELDSRQWQRYNRNRINQRARKRLSIYLDFLGNIVSGFIIDMLS
jgi:hypothetical protein